MVAARRSLTPRRSRSLGRRHQRDHAECRMVVVVALVEAHAAALVEGEGRVGRRAKSFGGRGHGIGQRQPEVQELAALEKDRATQARYVEAEALHGEAGPRSPGARRLRSEEHTSELQ